ncbi:MAG: OmpA family protein [Elusimicrobia bacterium]|nr:OmpA family protein [Elusimicrobiota bacterium]
MKKLLPAILLLGLAACASVSYEEREWARRDAQKLQTIKEMIASRQLPAIEFESDKAILLPASYETLNKIAQILIDNRTLKLVVEGHCDDVGSDDYNDALSYARAKAVKTYLTDRGVWPDYVKIYGYGERKPLVRSTTEEARALNRRVEFRLTTRNWQAIF